MRLVLTDEVHDGKRGVTLEGNASGEEMEMAIKMLIQAHVRTLMSATGLSHRDIAIYVMGIVGQTLTNEPKFETGGTIITTKR